MTKRILAALEACAVVMSAVGCGEPADSSQSVVDSSSAAATTTSAAASDTITAVTSTAEQQGTTVATTSIKEKLTEPKIVKTEPDIVETEPEDIVPIELIATWVLETPYTEFEAIGMLITNAKLNICTGIDVTICFDGFEDDPNNSAVKGWGCYPSALPKIIEVLGYNQYISDLTGCEASTLYEYIDRGVPVAVWITENLAKPEVEMESGGYQLLGPHECVTLVGYSDTSVMVWSILHEKYITYDRALFEQRFEEMGSMALVVEK